MRTHMAISSYVTTTTCPTRVYLKDLGVISLFFTSTRVSIFMFGVFPESLDVHPLLGYFKKYAHQ